MKKTTIAAYGFTLFLSFNLMSCNSGGGDDHQQNELQEEALTPTGRQEADSRGVTPGTGLEPVSPDDGANLSHTDPNIGGHEMMPTQLITENITSGINLATFASIIRHAGVVEQLAGEGPYTVFAPSNDAFEALPENELENLMKPENRARLREVVNNHVVAGALTANDLQDGAMLKTVGGAQLQVTKRNNTVAINGAEVEEANIMSENGVIHIVGKVLASE
ncbi:fasciclin domain-containing protein [Pontibacter diazotrophicus]|uniref:Fasciclin domain-containing protein n=1 Tax=Pontibacter diazotrophicus TaxID=1400979 RepID=A0A3D8LB66_9BACT|nr:fasciclin domain-containing protein [Pontibacter diazotrophicus]RDV14648.1 fasciclin domain-containing protein [Pontibacter diazotrophicus]